MSDDKSHNGKGSGSVVPKTGSAQWKRNETVINDNPTLKQARDIAQGLDKPADRYSKSGASHYGKGSRPRVNTNSQQYQDNWDKIFGKKDQDKDESN